MDVKEYNEKFLKEKKARSKMLCPRCGVTKLDRDTDHNAISKYEQGVFICSGCGLDEAMLEYEGKSLSLEMWAVAKWEQGNRV